MKKNSLPKPVTILILTLLTTVLWIGLNIYRSVTVKPATEVPEEILKPLNPILNTGVIQKIESAIFIPDSEIPVAVSAPAVTPQAPVIQIPTPTTAPVATSSASSGT
jgi:hypothetical protein